MTPKMMKTDSATNTLKKRKYNILIYLKYVRRRPGPEMAG
jgi:hypothetical protein